MLLSISLAALASGSGTVCGHSTTVAMALRPLGLATDQAATRSEQRNEGALCGSLPQSPQGCSVVLSAPAAWQTLDLPPPTR